MGFIPINLFCTSRAINRWGKLFFHQNIHLVGLYSLVLGVISYLFIDKTVAVSVSQLPHDDIFYKIGKFIDAWTGSKHIIYVEFLIGSICSWFILKEHNEVARKYAMVFLSCFFAYVVTFSIKMIVARYRPELFLSHQLYGFSWFNTSHALTSMPSGHATMNFALAFAVSIFLCAKYRLLCVVLILYGIAVAISRVVVGAHFISDVLAALTVASWSIVYVLNIKKAPRLLHE